MFECIGDGLRTLALKVVQATRDAFISCSRKRDQDDPSEHEAIVEHVIKTPAAPAITTVEHVIKAPTARAITTADSKKPYNWNLDRDGRPTQPATWQPHDWYVPAPKLDAQPTPTITTVPSLDEIRKHFTDRSKYGNWFAFEAWERTAFKDHPIPSDFRDRSGSYLDHPKYDEWYMRTYQNEPARPGSIPSRAELAVAGFAADLLGRS